MLSQPETTTSGLSITPRLRLQYFFGKRIGIWGESNYTFGPTIAGSRTTLVPEGRPNDFGSYYPEQLAMGTASMQTVETKFRSLGANVGISFALGKGIAHRDIKPKNLLIRNAPDGTSPLGDSTYVAKANDYGNTRSNRTNGVFVPGLATGNNYGDTLSNRRDGEFVPGLDTGNEPGSETEDNEYVPDGQAVPGVIIKGGRNPGEQMINTVSNEKGEIALKNLQPGNYKFEISSVNAEKNSFTHRRQVEVLKSNKQSDPSANKIEDSGTQPDGIESSPEIKISVAKNGFTTRRGVEVLKSNKQGDPSANKIEDSDTQPEVIGEITFDITEAGDYTLTIIR